MDQVKTQLEQAYAEQFLEVWSDIYFHLLFSVIVNFFFKTVMPQSVTCFWVISCWVITDLRYDVWEVMSEKKVLAKQYIFGI